MRRTSTLSLLILCFASLTLILSGKFYSAITQSAPVLSVSGQIQSPISFKADNWGLSFQQEGQTPVGNASIQELANYHAFYAQDTTDQILYLTFDCGYENGHTREILDTLKKHQVPAAFFVVGTFLESNPDLILQMVEDGHIVGNHTYHHPDMSSISSTEDFTEELKVTAEIYEKITGQPMKPFYRPPQGKYSTENLHMANELGFYTFFWSLAYVDWYENDQPTKEEAFSKLIGRIHPGAIVLLHNTSATNASILDELLTKWESMGYHFGSLQQLVDSAAS